MRNNRRKFIQQVALGAAGISLGNINSAFSAKSYARIIGANDRLNVALMGCGRRVSAYYAALKDKNNNVDVALDGDASRQTCVHRKTM